MEDWDGGGSSSVGGLSLEKRQSEKGEVDYKSKSGTAWSHSYLNQKPWHPLSYPNQRRKWIAEQTHANRERRSDEIAREFSQEQEFFRQTALFSKKEKEKMEIMKAVSFMYVRPPGYNAESAKAAEVADEKKVNDPKPEVEKPVVDKKTRPRDVFGRPLPTENEFEVLKNAPRLETGMPGRVKPFGIEIRNVRCVRCGTFGHQSGDRECPLKDVIMPNEESRLKRDDPLTTIMAQTSSTEVVKWELKQKPGMSPPRGGFQPDDPNQQIVADEIFDEYGGFLSGGDIPLTLLSNFSTGKSKKHSKNKIRHKHQPSSISRTKYKLAYESQSSSSNSDIARESKRSDVEMKKMPRNKDRWKPRNSSDSDVDQKKTMSRKREGRSSRKHKHKHGVNSSSESEVDGHRKKSSTSKHEKRRHGLRDEHYSRSPDSEIERVKRPSNRSQKKMIMVHHSVSSDSEYADSDSRHRRIRKRRHHKRNCTSN